MGRKTCTLHSAPRQERRTASCNARARRGRKAHQWAARGSRARCFAAAATARPGRALHVADPHSAVSTRDKRHGLRRPMPASAARHAPRASGARAGKAGIVPSGPNGEAGHAFRARVSYRRAKAPTYRQRHRARRSFICLRVASGGTGRTFRPAVSVGRGPTGSCSPFPKACTGLAARAALAADDGRGQHVEGRRLNGKPTAAWDTWRLDTRTVPPPNPRPRARRLSIHLSADSFLTT